MHLLLRQQVQRVDDIARVRRIADAHTPKQFLLYVDGGVGVVDSVLIAVGEDAPADAHDGRIAVPQVVGRDLVVADARDCIASYPGIAFCFLDAEKEVSS